MASRRRRATSCASIGSKATVVLDGYRLSCTGETSDEDFDPVATYRAPTTARSPTSSTASSTGTPFETAPADNLKTLALVEAAYARAEVHP